MDAALLGRDEVVGRLSERGLSVLRGLMAGRTQREIAEAEGVSTSAVSQRVRHDGLGIVLAMDELMGGVAMSWIGLLLVGVAVTDLVFSVRPMRHVPEVVGAAAAVLLGLLAGLTSGRDLLALAGHRAGRPGLGPDRHPRLPHRPRLAAAGRCSPARSASPSWSPGRRPAPAACSGGGSRRVGLPVLQGLDPDRALVLLGVVLLQLSTGNVVVRLVLAATHTLNPAREGTPSDPGDPAQGRAAARADGAAADRRPWRWPAR